MTTCSAISINDNLTSCQTAVSVWSSDYETSGRIDKVLGILIYHISRNDLIEYIFFDVCMDLLLRYIRIMLGRAYNCINTEWLAILIILYSYLCFSIWS